MLQQASRQVAVMTVRQFQRGTQKEKEFATCRIDVAWIRSASPIRFILFLGHRFNSAAASPQRHSNRRAISLA
jgi:hypothetical protein